MQKESTHTAQFSIIDTYCLTELLSNRISSLSDDDFLTAASEKWGFIPKVVDSNPNPSLQAQSSQPNFKL